MGRYSTVRKNKQPFTREVGAVDWLKSHPEDIPIAKENLYYRDKGFDNDGVRNLFAAICLRACIDYSKASRGVYVGNKAPGVVMEDCHNFFGNDIFQFFVNRIPVSEVERSLKSIPNGGIQDIWKKLEYNQCSQTHKK